MRTSAMLSGDCKIFEREIFVAKALQDGRNQMLPRCIYRVPECIRQDDKEAYTPQIVSIGPYHRGMERLKAMESDKALSRDSILSENKHISFDRLVEEMKRLESRIRSAYSEAIHLETNVFAEMAVLDGIFIIDLLIDPSRYYKRSGVAKWTIPLLRNDLLLLENQLPFFVLQALYDLIYPPDPTAQPSSGMQLMEHAVDYFKDHSQIQNLTIHKGISVDPCHLLHLVHQQLTHPSNSATSSPCYGFLPAAKKSTPSDSARIRSPQETEKKLTRIPSATKLQEAGISFKKKEGRDLRVKFKDGLMEIPYLYVEDSTNSFFRNQIAWEQCCLRETSYFTAYVLFMDYVVNTRQDVEILSEHEILDHGLGSDKDVALLFNKISKGIAYDFEEDNFFKDVSENVARYCGIKYHVWRAKLVHEYFSNPWAIISLIAAIFLLILTVVSTFFAVFAYYRPP